MGNLFASTITNVVFRVPPRSPLEWNSLTTSGNNDTCEVLSKYHEDIGTTVECLLCVPHHIKSSKTIVFCHGNGGDLLIMKDWIRHIASKLAIRVACVEYPGYGPPRKYGGDNVITSIVQYVKPSEKHCYYGILETINMLVERGISVDDMYLMGHSLGTGVVIDYAKKHQVTNPIILVSPYKSISRVMTDSVAGAMLGLEMFGSWYKLSYLKCPVKIFHSLHDELIVPKHAQDIYDHLPDKSLDITWISHASHMDTLDHVDTDIIGNVIGLSEG